MDNTPKIRTIKQTIQELKAKDSATAFTESALRRAISSGDIPHIRAGNKILVNLDVVESYLSGNIVSNHVPECGKIHRLA